MAAVPIDEVFGARKMRVVSEPVDAPWPAFSMAAQAPVRSKSNFRSGSDNWDAYRSFEQQFAAELERCVPDRWLRPDATIRKVLDRPTTVAVMWAATLVDAGNLSKSILDAAEGLLVVTDAEIAASQQLVTRRRTSQWFAVAFAQLPPAAPLRDCVAASTLLAGHLVDVIEAAEELR